MITNYTTNHKSNKIEFIHSKCNYFIKNLKKCIESFFRPCQFFIKFLEFNLH